MKRHGLRQLTAAALCALLLATSFSTALAENGVAVPMLSDETAPLMSVPVAPDSAQNTVSAVKVKATVDVATVNVTVTADPAYPVVVSLTQTDNYGNVTTYDSVTLKAGVTEARFDNVPVGSYTLTANYKTSDVPGAKAATMPIVIEAPVVTAAPTSVPTPEPTSAPAPEPANDGDFAQLPGGFPAFDAPVMPVPDVSAPSDGSATLETPQDNPVQPALPPVNLGGQSSSAENQGDSSAQNPDVMLPMLPLEEAPQIAEVPEIPGAEGDTPGTDDPTLPDGNDALPLMATMPIAADQTVTGTVSNIQDDQIIVVKLTPTAGGTTPEPQELDGKNGKEQKYTFNDVEPGEYTLTIAVKGQEESPIISVGITVAAPATTTKTIVANAQGGTSSITVTVVDMQEGLTVLADLYKDGEKAKDTNTERIESSNSPVKFDNLPAGTYTVNLSYESPNTGMTVLSNIVVTGELAPINIDTVTPGENKLTVTGTAAPGSSITFTTDPASASTVVTVGDDGKFTVDLALAAGTYTAVHAQYGSDAQSRATKEGTFVVTAPAQKPPLYVDPITASDWIVYAKTTPGVTVNLSTYDHGTTVVADSRGILRFSMPHEYPKGTSITFTVYYGADNVQSYQQVETVVGSISYKLLKKGSTGNAVYDLTLRLSDLGYPITPTHTYTDAVANAVRLFQSLNGLTVDGMAGQLTQSALYSVWAIGYYETGVYPTLVRGNRGMALIYTLQQRLKDLGYYTIRVDGIFGSGTERAVRDFQRVNGLTITGKADNATQVLLYSSAALPAWYYGGNYGSLSRSNYYNSAVVPLQRRLRELGYYTGSIDGYFGSQTQRAVRNFQSVNGLTITGVADSYTQQVLYSAGAKAASGSSSSSSSSTGYRLLYWGCKGEAVRRLQQALLNAGYTQVRVADGIYGQWTYDAVRAYQKDHGLTVDGIAGRNTQNSLYGTNY